MTRVSTRNNLLFCIVLLALSVPAVLSASRLGGGRINPDDFKRIKADHWSVVGKNIIVRGNVYLPMADFEVFADQAIVDIENQDLEVVGNVRLIRWMSSAGSVEPGHLTRLLTSSDAKVSIKGIDGNVFGHKKISVDAYSVADSLTADRMAGNMKSGYFRFDHAQLKFKNFVCRADSGERRPDGVITLKGAEVSGCSYLESDNSHYSISAGSMTLTPHNNHFYGVEHIEKDIGDYSIWMTNGFARIYGIPILWLPAFYKPKDESPGLFGTTWGSSGSWGYYGSAYRRFYLSEYPNSFLKIMADWYELRGFGYGLSGDIKSESSRTEFLAYSIYDIRPYETDDYDDYRLRVPHGRFDFRISNVTHITPSLDFRGNFEFVSDYYFLKDFFGSRYASDPQPSTNVSLEQQFDNFAASIYYRPRVNDFYTTVEKMPEVRLDLHRQQIFNTPFYYQGDLSAGYYRMKWVEFDREPKNPLAKLDDYESFRLDTTHFLYLPINLGWLNVVPRAGFRMTAYSKSSKTKVTDRDLSDIFDAADVESLGWEALHNYDDKGGSRVRFLGELGVEASTKIHNTWSDIRSDFFGIDGLRHIMRPYINYTFITRPNENREHLYYFDDIDRIEEENFFRIGIENRLQTRSSDNSISNYLTMENYLDIHVDRQNGMDNVGNFCTVLSFKPIRGLTITTDFSIDAGGNNDDLEPVMRNGREAGNPGLDLKWLNRWNLAVTYSPLKDFDFSVSYTYRRPYLSRSAYSMGSTLTNLESGSFFNNFFDDRDEVLTLGARIPLTPDRRTFLSASCSYDFIDGRWEDISFTVSRLFHCWEVIGALSFDRDDDDGSWDTSFSVQARLVGLEAPLQSVGAGKMLSYSNNTDGGSFF